MIGISWIDLKLVTINENNEKESVNGIYMSPKQQVGRHNKFDRIHCGDDNHLYYGIKPRFDIA